MNKVQSIEKIFLQLFALVIPLLLIAVIIPKGEIFRVLDFYRDSILTFCIFISFVLIAFTKLKTEFNITLNYWDLPLLLLVTYIFLSLFWTHNQAVTLKSATQWGLVFLFYKLITVLFQSKDYINLARNVFVVAVLINVVYAIPQLGLERARSDVSYNLYFSLLACLSPFLLTKFKFQLKHIWALIAFLLVSFFILQKNAQGAKLALFIGVALYFSAYLSKYLKINQLIFFLGTILLLIAGLYLNTKYIWITEISNFSDALGMNDRLIMWQRSIELFKENFLVGIGADNIRFLLNEEKMEGMFMGPMALNFFIFRHPHNLFFALLPELGIIGILLFITAFIMPVFIFMNKTLKGTENDAFNIAMVIFLMISSIYIITSESRFLLLAAVFSGFLNSHSKSISESKFSSYPLLLCSLSLLIWFGYANQLNYKLDRVLWDRSVNNENKITYAENLLSHKNVWLTFKKRHVTIFLINQLERKDKLTKEEVFKLGQYYKDFLKFDPYNMRILYQYAQYLYEKDDLFEAKKLLLGGLKIDETNFYIKLLLAKIEFEFGNYQYADILLNFKDKVFERVYKLEQKREWDEDFRYGSKDKSFIKTKEEIDVLRKKIKRKLHIQRRDRNLNQNDSN